MRQAVNFNTEVAFDDQDRANLIEMLVAELRDMPLDERPLFLRATKNMIRFEALKSMLPDVVANTPPSQIPEVCRALSRKAAEIIEAMVDEAVKQLANEVRA